MKIKKTSGGSMTTQTPLAKGVPAAPSTNKQEAPAPPSDIVSLSSDALQAAARVQATQAVTETGEEGGPLPDPRATAQAILEKELDAVFDETYL